MKYLNKFRKEIIITSTVANIFLILEVFDITQVFGRDLSVYKAVLSIVITSLIQLGIITSNEEQKEC